MVLVSKVLEQYESESGMVVVLSGVLLPAFGFEVGKKVVVEITHGQIFIKTVNAEC